MFFYKHCNVFLIRVTSHSSYLQEYGEIIIQFFLYFETSIMQHWWPLWWLLSSHYTCGMTKDITLPFSLRNIPSRFEQQLPRMTCRACAYILIADGHLKLKAICNPNLTSLESYMRHASFKWYSHVLDKGCWVNSYSIYLYISSSNFTLYTCKFNKDLRWYWKATRIEWRKTLLLLGNWQTTSILVADCQWSSCLTFQL